MSRYQSEVSLADTESVRGCTKCLKYAWKTITFLFSHIALVSVVVSYCALGAFTFAALEVEHEKEVKRSIKGIRENATEHFWKLVESSQVLDPVNFTTNATLLLQNFESALVKAMTKDGWDGEEDEHIVQWTTTGSLFYSIVVITTIGYGHIAPKTSLGKVVTIFYAILGIPLMLLCLSNIGDIMATSFRFLYWKVCCYMCTRPKKPKRSRSRSTTRYSERISRSRNASIRRSVRISTKSADSGFGRSEIMPTSRSESDLRYANEVRVNMRGASMPKMKAVVNNAESQKISTVNQTNQFNNRGGSLDRKKFKKTFEDIELDPVILAKTPILCNKYVLRKDELVENNIPAKSKELDEKSGTNARERKTMSMPNRSNYLELPRPPSPTFSEREDDDDDSIKRQRRRKSPRLETHSPSPKMMTPLGYGHRSKYLDDPDSDVSDFYEDGYYDSEKQRSRPVPIGLCVFLVISYIVGGAFLFDYWEKWGLLDSAYFCFITLTTIGFGDLVPAKGVSLEADETTTTVTISIALCSLYLLFGISLLAMSFNLVQEEVISSVKGVAKSLGIIRSDEESETDNED